ncbi:MAG TPA: hypothetical protein VL201_01110 [Patescibacteria group bacterium]|jgi:hypothetical protein|nr:hypothetical protein [Patescibacteria group bacterium]
MKTSFLSFFHVLFLSLIGTSVLFCPDPSKSPDTQTGIAYQLLFEQRFPFVDKAVDPKDISETMATMLMLNSFKAYYIKEASLLSIKFDKQEAKDRLQKTEKIAFKKIEKTINELIDNHITEVINNRTKIFQKKEDKGLLGKVARKARGKVANLFSSKNIPLEEHKDFKFRHVSPAYTDAAPGFLKNNLEYLYEELFTIIQTARTVADLFVLSIFLNEGNTQRIETRIKNINIAQKGLSETLETYIKEIYTANLETSNSLAFFARQYQSDSTQIISTVSRFLYEIEHTAVSRRPRTDEITSQDNIENLLTFTILPTSFIDSNITNVLHNNETTITKQKNEITTLEQQIQRLEKEKSDLQFRLQASPYLKEERKKEPVFEFKRETTSQNRSPEEKIRSKLNMINAMINDPKQMKDTATAKTLINQIKEALPLIKDKKLHLDLTEEFNITEGRLNEAIRAKEKSPQQIPAKKTPQPSEEKTQLLALQVKIEEATSLAELNNIEHKLEIINVSRYTPEFQLYSDVHTALQSKKEFFAKKEPTQRLSENVQQEKKLLLDIQKDIKNAESIYTLDNAETEFNRIHLFDHSPNWDLHNEVSNDLKAKKKSLGERK